MKKIIISTLFVAQIAALQISKADEVLISKNGITLTDTEIKAAYTDLPPNTIAAMEQNPKMAITFVEGIFENKLMAVDVHKKLANDPKYKMVLALNDNQFSNNYYIKQKLRAKLKETDMPTLVQHEFASNKAAYGKPETRDYYHIYFYKEDNMTTKSPKDIAEAVLADIKSGKITMAAAAKKYHIAIAGGDENGVLKNIEDKSLSEQIKKVASTMKVGEISNVIETPEGYHIISLIKINPPVDAVLDKKLEDKIAAKLQEQIISLVLKEERSPYKTTDGVKFDKDKLDKLFKDLSEVK